MNYAEPFCDKTVARRRLVCPRAHEEIEIGGCVYRSSTSTLQMHADYGGFAELASESFFHSTGCICA